MTVTVTKYKGDNAHSGEHTANMYVCLHPIYICAWVSV